MKASALDLFATMHWDLASIVLVLMAMFLVEGFRILGRASAPNVAREKFKLGEWIGQFANWFSIVLSFVSALSLLAIRDGMIDSLGLVIADTGNFEYYFAFGVGALGQTIVKIVLKAFMGMFGAFGKAEQ